MLSFQLLKPISGKLRAQWETGLLQAAAAAAMPAEERRAKFTFLYVGGQLHLNPHAAREAGLAVEVPGAALGPTEVPGGAAGDPGSWSEEGGPIRRRRRARLGGAAESQDGGPGAGTVTPPEAAEASSQRGLGSPPRRRKAAGSTLRGRKGDAASQFLVFCQRHRDEVGAMSACSHWACACVCSTCFSAFPGPPALCKFRPDRQPCDMNMSCGEQMGLGPWLSWLLCARTWPSAQLGPGHVSPRGCCAGGSHHRPRAPPSSVPAELLFPS